MTQTIEQLANLTAAATTYYAGAGTAAAAVADIFQAPIAQIEAAVAAVGEPNVRAAAAVLDSCSTAGRDVATVQAEVWLRVALGTRCALRGKAVA